MIYFGTSKQKTIIFFLLHLTKWAKYSDVSMENLMEISTFT